LITVAKRFKANVYGCWLVGIVGSNAAWGMDVLLYLEDKKKSQDN
jgi:hypothetical protein